jgi:hypothetical protein
MSGPHCGAVLSIGWVLLGVAAVPVFAEHRTPTGESDVVPRLGSQGASLTDDTPPPTGCSSGPCEKQDASTRRDKSESAPHSLFVKYWLIDGFWVPTQSGDHTVGLVGAHLAIAQIGRLYIYGPPGVMVLRADGDRGRVFRPGYSWGFSFRLMEFTWPNTHRRAILFGSFTKCWTFGDYRTGSSMAGLSVSWKK